MIGASKILTVSYGTFSCTLEGFDDPFNTMKAIAEYFRDLAAEDRYFGAEPPQPDAAMLHRIAEREIQRRVEAKIQDNGVILRAEHGAPALVAEPDAPAPVPSVVAAPQADVIAESVAAKLSRLRAAQPVAEMPQDEFEAEAESLLPDPSLSEFLAAPASDAPIAEPPAPVTSPDPGRLPAAEAAAHPRPVPAPRPAPPRPAATARPVPAAPARPARVPAKPATPAPAPVAAAAAPVAVALPEDLTEGLSPDEAFALSEALGGLPTPDEEEAEALAEVVAAEGKAAEGFVDDIFPETDDHVAEPADLLPETLPEAAPEELALSQPLEQPAQPDAAPAAEIAEEAKPDTEPQPAHAVQETEDAAEDDLAALIATLAGGSAGPEAPHEAAATAEEYSEPALVDAVAEILIDPEAEAEPAEAIAETAAEAVDDAMDEPAHTEALLVEVEEDLPETEIEAEAAPVETKPVADEEPPRPELRATEPGAAHQAETEPAAPVAAAAPAPAAMDKLQRARARVIRIRRSDAAPAQEQAQTPVGAADDARAETQPEPRRRIEGEADEEAVNRLIAQTNSEMEGPEARRRLSAIAHLKAAVAATVAERLSRNKPATPTEAIRAEPYRDDLARAVRPRRPEPSGMPSERPAPLVLVSEQRIDRPATSPAPVAPAVTAATPVRPRRVTSAALAVQAQDAEDEDDEDDYEDPANIFTDTRGFVEFAERLRVRSLPDLMEAAAAYTAMVEGRPHFSRPHLIRHLTAARGSELPREDSLRTFGRLLREGRIEKVKRGQFAVSGNSRFLAETRKSED